MGQSASKRVEKSLDASSEFRSACAAVYADCIAVSQHAFAGVKPYQLVSAAEHLHRLLHSTIPVISKWVPCSPDRNQVDKALKKTLIDRDHAQEITLDEVEFRRFATELFVDAVVSGAGTDVIRMLPLGVVGIAGIGAVVKPGKNVVIAAVGTYALGVVTTVYLGLNG